MKKHEISDICSVCGDTLDKHFHYDPETGLEVVARCYKRCRCGKKDCRGSEAV